MLYIKMNMANVKTNNNVLLHYPMSLYSHFYISCPYSPLYCPLTVSSITSSFYSKVWNITSPRLRNSIREDSARGRKCPNPSCSSLDGQRTLMIDVFILVLFTALGSSVPQAAAWHFGHLHCPAPLCSNAKGFNQVLLSISFKKLSL